jgi:hypothetical protein
MQNKIIFSILVSLVVSIFIVLYIHSIYPEPITDATTDNMFYFKKFDPKKERIFLIGSSNIGQLNTTMINELISENNPSFEVYNLAISSDEPSSRLPHLEKMIVLKPKLVIYGLTYRDFQLCGFNSEICDAKIHHFLLPDIKKIIENNIPKEIQQNKFNPELTTLRLIRESFGGSGIFTENDKIWLPSMPFYYIDPNFHHTIIEKDEELENQSNMMKKEGYVMDVSENSPDVKALKTIIKSFKENDIKLVLYLMPQNQQYYLDNISEKDKQDFNLLINVISDEFDIPLYNFTYAYSNDKIWGDTRHISYNINAKIFSQDMAQIILNEIGH